MKHVVSVSPGSSKRDAYIETEILGEQVVLERRGTDGDLKAAAAIIRELDGKVDAIGLGGLDIVLMAGGRRYYMREGVNLAKNAKETPVVCGAGLKDSLERQVVRDLSGLVNWQGKKVLMAMSLDRFGMAQTLEASGAEMLYGDVIFALGLPLPLRSIRTVGSVARFVLPAALQLPFSWLYPTGKDQDSAKATRHSRYFNWAEVIAGDFHYIKRYAPARLDGKTILTNTTTPDDVETMRAKGVSRLITTTPRYHGRSLSTNLLEAALIAVAGKHPLTPQDYQELIARAALKPDVLELNPKGVGSQ
ncbi:MAG: quinate 5-dehydrogenase [Deinococcota bacterium]|jgi:hypothetical protein|nr:quinate 5-dehydrogenase [Deinococcota bacterium]